MFRGTCGINRPILCQKAGDDNEAYIQKKGTAQRKKTRFFADSHHIYDNRRIDCIIFPDHIRPNADSGNDDGIMR